MVWESRESLFRYVELKYNAAYLTDQVGNTSQTGSGKLKKISGMLLTNSIFIYIKYKRIEVHI